MAAAVLSPSPLFCFMGRGGAGACGISDASGAVPSAMRQPRPPARLSPIPTSVWSSRNARAQLAEGITMKNGENGGGSSIRNLARSAFRRPWQIRVGKKKQNHKPASGGGSSSSSSGKLTFFDVAVRTVIFVSLFGFETVRTLAVFLGIFAAWSAFWLAFVFLLLSFLEIIPDVVDFTIMTALKVLMAVVSLPFAGLDDRKPSAKARARQPAARRRTTIRRVGSLRIPFSVPIVEPVKSKAESEFERWDHRFATAHGPALPNQLNQKPEMESAGLQEGLAKKELAEWDTSFTIRQLMRDAVNQDRNDA